jgi:uncharacterized protein YbcV (DUF1398 family)
LLSKYDGGMFMSNKPTVKALHEIIERRSTGKKSFAEFLEELAAIGIIQYDIDVSTGQATYKGGGSELKTEPQVTFAISNQFNRKKALETIANITLPFLDFLKEIANAGIITYTVNITEKKAIYMGVNGDQIVEPLKI